VENPPSTITTHDIEREAWADRRRENDVELGVDDNQVRIGRRQAVLTSRCVFVA
jgi:hypothetical protein